jgi:aspartate aminotransferase-like enzyme
MNKLRDILPSEPLLLMGAGPVPITSVVARANGVVINHLGPTMNKVIDGLQTHARYVFQTEAEHIIGVAGPSSAAMEMMIAGVLWPGRTALVLSEGIFGERWAEMARRCGATVETMHPEEQGGFSVKQFTERCDQLKPDVVLMTHGETSVGRFVPELATLASVAKKRKALVLVDTVTTLGVVDVPMDDWQLDGVIAGGQKGLGSIPGISLVALSDDAWSVITNRAEPPTQWVLDAKAAWEFWGPNHGYHYTAPVPGVLALFQALELIADEGLDERFARHQASSVALQQALTAMGLQLSVEEPYRLQSVVAINVPDRVESQQIRSFMADTFGVEISGSFGANIIRIGQMGEQCRAHNLFKTVYALGMACRYYGVEVNVAAAMSTLEEQLASDPETFVV